MNERCRAVVLWVACTPALPILWAMQLLQALFGSPKRSIKMAIAQDGCGNALFGGDPDVSISTRTGRALLDGKPWAEFVAPIIDWFFGKNHCRDSA